MATPPPTVPVAKYRGPGVVLLPLSLPCLIAGAPGIESTVPPRARRKRTAQYVLLGVLAVVVTLIVVTLVPIPHSLSVTLVTVPVGNPVGDGETIDVVNVSIPTGSQVTGSWSSADGVNVTFSIDPRTQGPLAYESTGTSGSFSFVAHYSSFIFGASTTGNTSATVSVSGTYSLPLLQV